MRQQQNGYSHVHTMQCLPLFPFFTEMCIMAFNNKIFWRITKTSSGGNFRQDSYHRQCRMYITIIICTNVLYILFKIKKCWKIEGEDKEQWNLLARPTRSCNCSEIMRLSKRLILKKIFVSTPHPFRTTIFLISFFRTATTSRWFYEIDQKKEFFSNPCLKDGNTMETKIMVIK